MVADHSWGMAARSPTPPVDTPAPALAGESSGRRERLLILVLLPLDSDRNVHARGFFAGDGEAGEHHHRSACKYA